MAMQLGPAMDHALAVMFPNGGPLADLMRQALSSLPMDAQVAVTAISALALEGRAAEAKSLALKVSAYLNAITAKSPDEERLLREITAISREALGTAH